MRKKIILTESKLRKIVKTIVEQVEEEYYKISPQEYMELMKLSGYHGKGISKLPKFQGKPLWITGDLRISNTPTDSLGNIGYVDGTLDISNTNVSDISGIKVKTHVWDSNTPIYRRRKAAEFAKKMSEAQERRDNKEWDLETVDDEGEKAHALFQWLVSNGDIEELSNKQMEILTNLKLELDRLQKEYDKEEDSEIYNKLSDRISEIEDEISELEENNADVYNIYPDNYKFYSMEQFEVIGVDGLTERKYSVGTHSEMEAGALEYAENMIDDVQLDSFNESFLSNNIDTDYLKSYVEEFYEDDIWQNPDVYFNDDDYELTREQEERKENLENYIEELDGYIERMEEQQSDLEGEIEDADEYSQRYDEIQKMIDDATENRDSSQEELDNIEPDTEPTQDMVDNLVSERVSDALSDPIDFIRNFGLEVKDFVNKDDMAQALVDADGWGIMNSYDGNYDSMSVNNETYYVMRVE
jgi:hypothetical protein